METSVNDSICTSSDTGEVSLSPVPSDILKDVVAYVEVRTASDNRSAAIQKVLERLGARVEQNFTDEVTHVIFKEGKKRTYDRAIRRNVHLVSVLWVDQCREQRQHVPEKGFVANTEKYLSPPPGVRWKKCKSMQPRDFNDEMTQSAERLEKRRKRMAHVNRFFVNDTVTPDRSSSMILVEDTQPRSAVLSSLLLQSPGSITIPVTPPSMQARILQLQKEKEAKKNGIYQSPVSLRSDPEIPLQRKLFTADEVATSEEQVGQQTSAVLEKKPRLESSEDEEEKYLKATQIMSPDGKDINEKSMIPGNKKLHTASQLDSEGSPVYDNQLNCKRRSMRLSNKFFTRVIFEDKKEDDIKVCHKESLKEGGQLDPKRVVSVNEEFGYGPHSEPADKFHPDSADKFQLDSADKFQLDLSDRLHSDSTDTLQPDLADKPPSDSVDKASLDKKFKPKRRSTRLSSYGNFTAVTVISQSDKKTSLTDSSTECRREQDGGSGTASKIQIKGQTKVQGAERRRSRRSLATSLSTTEATAGASNISLSGQQLASGSAVPFRKDEDISKDCIVGLSEKCVIEMPSDSSSVISIKKTPIASVVTTGRKRKLHNLDQEMELFVQTPESPGKCKLSEKQKEIEHRKKSSQVDNIFLDAHQPVKKGRRSLCKTKENKGKINSRSKKKLLTSDSESEEKPAFRKCLPKRMRRSSGCQNTSDSVLGCLPSNNMLGASMSMAVDEAVTSASFVNQQEHAKTRASIGEFRTSSNRRQSSRLKIQLSLSSVSESDDTSAEEKKQTSSQQYSKQFGKKSSIVMTSLHRQEQELVITAVKRLGGFVLENNVSCHTTHLVCGEPRRTLNILHGLARGCWILSKTWVIQSLEAEKWLPEETFELTKEFPKSKVARLVRQQISDGDYRSNLFDGIGNVFVSKFCTPPRNQVVALLRLCGAKVTENVSRAELHIGNESTACKVSIKPLWVLDSITQQELLKYEDYIVAGNDRPKRESSPEF